MLLIVEVFGAENMQGRLGSSEASGINSILISMYHCGN